MNLIVCGWRIPVLMLADDNFLRGGRDCNL